MGEPMQGLVNAIASAEYMSPEFIAAHSTDNSSVFGSTNVSVNKRSKRKSSHPIKLRIKKKRSRNEKDWKRNQRKDRRLKGEEYVNSKGDIVPGKNFSFCDSCCVKKCYEQLSGERQEILFKNFYSIGSLDLQTAYLFSQIKVVKKLRCYAKKKDGEENFSRRSSTFQYYLPDSNGIEVKVCKEFFKKVFQVSDGRIARVAKIRKDGRMPSQDQRGRHPPKNKTPEIKKQEVKEFIEKYFDSRELSKGRKFMDREMNAGVLYRLYVQDTENPVSRYIFTELYNQL